LARRRRRRSVRGNNASAEGRGNRVVVLPARPASPRRNALPARARGRGSARGCCACTRQRRHADNQLLKKYAPVLVLHPDERFRPTKVQSFVADSQLERFTGTAQAQLPLDAFWTVVDPDPEPGELPQPGSGIYRLDVSGCSAAGTLAGIACYADAWATGAGGDAVYGRVARTADRIVLQYWLFYYDKPLLLPPTPFGVFWQSHEGDWEQVDVVLDDHEHPLEAAYSQHCAGQRLSWGKVDRSPEHSTHPVAYVALGSHANYFAPGVFAITCLPSAVAAILPGSVPVVDRAATGAVVEPQVHRIVGQALGPVPAGPIAFGPAPASPANQDKWRPETALAWPKIG
jgi:hypothetical protein